MLCICVSSCENLVTERQELYETFLCHRHHLSIHRVQHRVQGLC